MAQLRQTALFKDHKELGAKMVPFAGWSMPVQYADLKREHLNVRQNVGLFDVSHMGEIRFRGEQALPTLEWLTSNSVAKLKAGQAQYSLLTNENGGLVDDIIVYCLEERNDYLVCVNAANCQKDWNWIVANNKGAEISDESELWSQIAIQGPKAMQLIERIFNSGCLGMKAFSFLQLDYKGAKIIMARTGYTGEDGVEIFLPNQQAPSLWQECLEKGQDLGVLPIGLGARDTLRLEKKFSLYGHEISDGTNPYAAGLGWVVKPDAKDFIGKQVILQEKTEGIPTKLVGFKLLERGIPRQHYDLISFDKVHLGTVTSGTYSPSLQMGIGMAYLPLSHAKIGSQFYLKVRNRELKAEVVKTPFV